MAETAPIPYLPVEPLFDRIVEQLGGVRIDDHIRDPARSENADYYFEKEAVIAELKELVADPSEDDELRKRISDVYNRYASSGHVPPVFGTITVDLESLPPPCQREMLLPYKRRFEGPIKKAARQLKKTKARLRAPGLKGLLILVNDGNTFLRPDIAFYFLSQILRGQYSSIDHVVYCSVNTLVVVPEEPLGAVFWAGGYLPSRCEIPSAFMERFQTVFREVIDEEVGLPGRLIEHSHDQSEPLPVIKRPHIDDPTFFVQPGKFYRHSQLGCSYYCDSTSGGTATMYLIESYREGKLVQAVYTQKLIYATRAQYQLVADREELARLRAILKKLKKA